MYIFILFWMCKDLNCVRSWLTIKATNIQTYDKIYTNIYIIKSSIYTKYSIYSTLPFSTKWKQLRIISMDEIQRKWGTRTRKSDLKRMLNFSQVVCSTMHRKLSFEKSNISLKADLITAESLRVALIIRCELIPVPRKGQKNTPNITKNVLISRNVLIFNVQTWVMSTVTKTKDYVSF